MPILCSRRGFRPGSIPGPSGRYRHRHNYFSSGGRIEYSRYDVHLFIRKSAMFLWSSSLFYCVWIIWFVMNAAIVFVISKTIKILTSLHVSTVHMQSGWPIVNCSLEVLGSEWVKGTIYIFFTFYVNEVPARHTPLYVADNPESAAGGSDLLAVSNFSPSRLSQVLSSYLLGATSVQIIALCCDWFVQCAFQSKLVMTNHS